MKHFLEILGDCVLAGFGLALTIAFVDIYRKGYFVVGEENKLILIAEIILSFLTICFGIYHFIKDVRKD